MINEPKIVEIKEIIDETHGLYPKNQDKAQILLH